MLSFLYIRLKLFPGIGDSSYKNVLLENEAGTISKSILTPFIFLEKGNIGSDRLFPFILYCSVGTPPIVSFAVGLPTNCSRGKDAFKTALNCSNQLSLVTSFHNIDVLARFCPEESNTDSVVEIASIFKNPEPAIFLLG